MPLIKEVRAIIKPWRKRTAMPSSSAWPKISARMRTDRTKLKQCLLNILSNANKFTENGTLTLVAERFEPTIRGPLSPSPIPASA